MSKWEATSWREGLFYQVWRLKWSDAFGSAYDVAKDSLGFRKRFWTRKAAQRYADKLNKETP